MSRVGLLVIWLLRAALLPEPSCGQCGRRILQHTSSTERRCAVGDGLPVASWLAATGATRALATASADCQACLQSISCDALCSHERCLWATASLCAPNGAFECGETVDLRAFMGDGDPSYGQWSHSNFQTPLSIVH